VPALWSDVQRGIRGEAYASVRGPAAERGRPDAEQETMNLAAFAIAATARTVLLLFIIIYILF